MRIVPSLIALGIGMALSACAGENVNRSLYSVHQPVVTRDNYTIDVTLDAGGAMSAAEKARVGDWFDALGLGYGDRIAIDYGSGYASGAAKAQVADLAATHGMLLNPTAPVTTGDIAPGSARIVVTRSTASVPGCPDWSDNSETNFKGRTHSNFGCATNSNMAAMIADPEDLVRGRESGDTNVKQASKAIEAYRERKASAGTTTKVQN